MVSLVRLTCGLSRQRCGRSRRPTSPSAHCTRLAGAWWRPTRASLSGAGQRGKARGGCQGRGNGGRQGISIRCGTEENSPSDARGPSGRGIVSVGAKVWCVADVHQVREREGRQGGDVREGGIVSVGRFVVCSRDARNVMHASLFRRGHANTYDIGRHDVRPSCSHVFWLVLYVRLVFWVELLVCRLAFKKKGALRLSPNHSK